MRAVYRCLMIGADGQADPIANRPPGTLHSTAMPFPAIRASKTGTSGDAQEAAQELTSGEG